jgi:ActR/RegA family two-component response regulator/DNA-binding HxlR family transcriptional regulator
VRLLIVDDDAVFREELGDLLKDEGHEVSLAPSVPKALELLDQQDLDIVFTDLKMPRQSGMELLKEVRQRWPRVLVVMITGFATVETAVEAMKVGAFDYIRKPFQINHVHKVLDLARQEFQFRGEGEKVSNIETHARDWASKDGRDVLWFTTRPVRSRDHIQVQTPDYDNPFRMREFVEEFLTHHGRAALVLEGADQLFAKHRRQEILEFMSALRDRLQGIGPLLVTFDPKHLSDSDALDLRAAVVAPNTRATLEALSNPIRRSVLRRTAEGPCTFTEAMRAAGMDDSPKLSFHLRKLIEDGLLGHQGEEYRITSRGRDAIRLLTEMDAIAASGIHGNAVLASPSGP